MSAPPYDNGMINTSARGRLESRPENLDLRAGCLGTSLPEDTDSPRYNPYYPVYGIHHLPAIEGLEKARSPIQPFPEARPLPPVSTSAGPWCNPESVL